MLILLTFAFISGLITIFAPCIWPLLPIILSSTTTGGHRKPLGITLGIMLSFGLLTLTISYLVKIIPFDPNALRFIAVGVIGFLGLTLVIPSLSAKLEALVSRLSGRLQSANNNNAKSSGFMSGFVTGLSLGIVWTPCAGPILATIATLAATQSVNINIVLVTAVYILGVGIPLFIFATLGTYLFTKTRFLSKYTAQVQQVFGVIMILTAVAIATNYDKVLQAKLLDAFPSYANFIYDLEGNKDVKKQLDLLKGNKETKPLFNLSGPSLQKLGNAPDIEGGTRWLNLPEGKESLALKDLRGKVVLVDFWTYTCINCIRTLPHVTRWYDKYNDKGFVVIGVHSPEFEFEKNTNNVLSAIKQYNIHYPVVQDNNFTIWKNYDNQYWPAKYLIDENGVIRKTHFGEGEYEEMEKAIQDLLEEAGKNVDTSLENMPDKTPRMRNTPETYLGSSRMEFYYPSRNLPNGTKNLQLSDSPPDHHFSLGGEWTVQKENLVSGTKAVLLHHFIADKVFLVLRPPAPDGAGLRPAKIKIYLDGKVVGNDKAGKDVKDGVVLINSDRLYDLIDLRNNPGKHILKLEFQTPGTEAFAFTFG